MQSIDVSKHVKNLSVRYLSTIMPSEHNLDEWIVLPLFQHGQDIPIENDGRTAILVAHAPSLERLLKAWHERVLSEQHARERRRQQKAARREGRREEPSRTEHRKRKESSRQSKGTKFSRNETESEDYHTTTTSKPSTGDENIAKNASASNFELCPVKKEDPYTDFDYEYSSNYDMTMDGVGEPYCDLELDEYAPPIIYGTNSPFDDDERVLNLGIHNEDCFVPGGEDWTCPIRSRLVKKETIDDLYADVYEEHSLFSDNVLENSDTGEQLYMKEKGISSLSRDDDEDVLEMERQIASIQARGEEENLKVAKSVYDTISDIRLESDHAASNLERELNGEAVECKKFTETLLRVEPSSVVSEPVQEIIIEQSSTSTKAEKKQSASSRIKHNLLKRMAEGRDVDVEATNAAASENDYRNTFCYLCKNDFSSSKALYLHNVKTHSDGEVQCDVCFKPLKNRITLMKHKKLHLGAEDMQCLCTECGRPFKDKRALSAHVTYTKHMLGVPLPKA